MGTLVVINNHFEPMELQVAIDPRAIMVAIEMIGPNTDIPAYMETIYANLPTCVARAIACLQCTQLEPDYKAQRARLIESFNFDIHTAFRQQIELILKRRSQ